MDPWGTPHKTDAEDEKKCPKFTEEFFYLYSKHPNKRITRMSLSGAMHESGPFGVNGIIKMTQWIIVFMFIYFNHLKYMVTSY